MTYALGFGIFAKCCEKIVRNYSKFVLLQPTPFLTKNEKSAQFSDSARMYIDLFWTIGMTDWDKNSHFFSKWSTVFKNANKIEKNKVFLCYKGAQH